MEKLLRGKAGQSRVMTITEGPDVTVPEIGNWYSPEAVAEMIAVEREACANVCRDLAKSHKLAVGVECDDTCDFIAAWETAGREIMARSNAEITARLKAVRVD